MQKELIDEKLKVRGLSEALEDPMNVHRWRKLEGTDSDTYEMITKIQTLQKRLIGKTEEVLRFVVIVLNFYLVCRKRGGYRTKRKIS